MTQAERRRRSRTDGAWPNPPVGRAVVLHTRVVTETGGGPDKTIFNSAQALADTPYWLAAAYMHPPKDSGFEVVRQRARSAGCPLISVPDRGPLDRGVLRRLLNICRRYKVRVWHGHDYKSNMLGLLLRPFHGMKLVTTVHGWVKHTLRTPLYYAVDRWSLPYYHQVICVSDDLVEEVRRVGVPPERCVLIRNGIDEERFRRTHPPAESPLRARHGVPPGRLVVGAVGRLSPEKAFGSLIQAAHQLLKEGIDLELWIAGVGDQQADLEALVARLGVAERVRLLGFCDDTVALYHAMDAFVLSSLREGLPNVVLEAMAMSVPVLSTRVAGVPAVIRDGENGLLCEPGDAASLVAPLRRLLTDAGLRQRLAAAERQTVERELTFRQRMQREREVYDRLLSD